MLTLYYWKMESCDGEFIAWGFVSGHPRLPDGFIHTSAVQEASVSDGVLLLRTASEHLYALRPEGIDPGCREETAACLAFFGIDADFVERCVQSWMEADAGRQAEMERTLGHGELLLEMVGTTALQAFFRTAEERIVSIRRNVDLGMFQDSVLLTDWEGRTVDFRYFPMGSRVEPYHISDGLRVIKVRNLGSTDVLFGAKGKEVVCRAGEITSIPAAEYNNEGLLSTDAVNGKSLLQTPHIGRGEEPSGEDE